MRVAIVLLLLLVAAFMTASGAKSSDKGSKSWEHSTAIKHVITVMFENRSFDHMLGWLKAFRINHKVNGLTGFEKNPIDPSNPSAGEIRVSFDQVDMIGWDPDHSLDGTKEELFASKTVHEPANMKGFVWGNNLQKCSKGKEPYDPRCDPMKGYNATGVPASAFLATWGAIFDAWHCDLPGPTQPNRMFSLSGTSHGWTTGPSWEEWVEGYPQRTIMNDFEDAGLPWKVYFSDFPVSLELLRIRDHPTHVHSIDDFFDDLKSGDLPAYSWVEPRWFDFYDWLENDQHPPPFNGPR